MKIVLNKCYGGFSLSEQLAKDLGLSTPFSDIDRTNKDLIYAVENFSPEYINSYYSNLQIVNIPDEISDWEISENDGFESLIYVLNGKIFHA